MEYGDFDAERRRIVRAWGAEITDPEELAAAVDRLRELAPTVDGEADRAKAIRYLKPMDDLVHEARTPESIPVREASNLMIRASAPEGTAAERRARAAAGMAEIARIAYAAPTVGERDAALEMNETLAQIIEMADRGLLGD
ncbi:hypothetical protein ACFV9C_09310 [Kribbella sp. NPDC059898]|uniref:hypothetical protein n=1 Tax=Kribbella sp. NPDC059898 TaxID=3346995 RepID=UPI00364E445B